MTLNIIARLIQKFSLKKCGNFGSDEHESKPLLQDNSIKEKDFYPPKNTTANTSINIFEALPPELLIYMAQFLPLSSTALFSLTCRTAAGILGARWTSLREIDNRQQHIDFLSQLSKDLSPNYVPCYHCRVLHICTIRYSDSLLSTRPRYQDDLTHCHQAEVLGKVAKYIHPDFQFRTFQMAMKQHRRNPEKRNVWLLFLNIELESSILRRFFFHFKADARIVGDSLLFRSRTIISIPPGLTIYDMDPSSFDICPHVKLMARGVDANMPETAECAIKHKHNRQECARRSRIIACSACPTEYTFSLHGRPNSGVMAMITKWMDLGGGETIMDPRWWSHLSNEYFASATLGQVDDDINARMLLNRDPIRSNHASIRNSFEQAT